MRDAPLTTIKGGINRLRTKGGARADTLYDLVNGYCTSADTVVSRPGTSRVMQLDTATKGLCSFGGSLYTFCHAPVYVPDGITLKLIVHPDILAENAAANFTMTAAKHEETPVYDVLIGGDVTNNEAPDDFGTLTSVLDINGTISVVAFFSQGDDPLTTEIVLRLTESGAAVGPDAFLSLTFEDTHGVSRTLEIGDATDPYGTDVAYWDGTYTEWRWTLVDAPVEVFTVGETYAVAFDDTTGSEVTTPGADIGLLDIHFAEPFMGALYVVAEFSNGNIYHYWLQEGEQWEANKVYKLGDLVFPADDTGLVYRATRLGSANPPWGAHVPRFDASYGSGYEVSVIEPTVYNDYYYTCIATTGASPRSGTIEPDWPTEDGATVIESTDNPPDVNIPTSIDASASTTPASAAVVRYGRYGTTRTVLR